MSKLKHKIDSKVFGLESTLPPLIKKCQQKKKANTWIWIETPLPHFDYVQT